MFAIPSRSCCTAFEIGGFSYMSKPHIDLRLRQMYREHRDYTVGFCFTTTRQLNVNAILHKFDFYHTEVMRKKGIQRHPETRITMWWMPVSEFNYDAPAEPQQVAEEVV